MLDQEADEPLVRAQRRAMDAERRLLGVVLVAIDEDQSVARPCEIHLVGRQREFAANDAPDLHVNLRAVKRGFVRHFDVIDVWSIMSVSGPCLRSSSKAPAR